MKLLHFPYPFLDIQFNLKEIFEASNKCMLANSSPLSWLFFVAANRSACGAAHLIYLFILNLKPAMVRAGIFLMSYETEAQSGESTVLVE